MNTKRAWEPYGKRRTSFGNSLGLSSWRQTLPKSEAASGLTPDRCSTASFSACAAGCQWNRLPKELGDDSTIHRTFQRWVELGVLRRIWRALVEQCEELGGVDWEWQAADGGHGQGTFGGDLIGPNPTDRGKAGSKRSLLVEGQGGPLSIVVAGANAHDATLLDETLEAIVVERPQLTEDDPQHLCLDKGYEQSFGSSSRRQTRLSATHPTHRRGEVGRFWAQAVSCAPVGCGTDSSMALQVPCGSGTLRQKGVELHRIATACVRTPVVPSPMATCHFEIVS